jgi:putative flippase GtrA
VRFLNDSQLLMERSEFRRFVMIGALNTAIFYGFYEGLYFLSSGLEHRAAMSWVLAYSMGSIIAHTTHRLITFKSNVPIEHSLPMAVGVYGVTLILSTISEVILIEILDWPHRLAWVTNTVSFGLIIYIALRHLAFPTRLSTKETE